jgi:hypothetical protein
VLKHSLIILEGREVCILTRSANTINENPVQTYCGQEGGLNCACEVTAGINRGEIYKKKSDTWARRNLNNLN